MAARRNNIYKNVLSITHVYLGPAADRFIARQIRNHLHKEPEKISQEDLGQLIDWIGVAVSLLSQDTETVDEYISKLEALAHANHKKSNARRT